MFNGVQELFAKTGITKPIPVAAWS